MRRTALRGVAATVIALAVGVMSAPAPSSSAPASPPTRILVVGDSVTQGSVGDWTWRYRLWQHLESVGADVDFVGPTRGLFDPATEGLDDARYADPAFDSDHSARWGQAFWVQDYEIGDLVRTFQPDVVIEMLGTNDLLFSGKSVDDTLAALDDFVDQARAADPDVDVVVGALPQEWEPAIAEYDAALPALAADATTDMSSVVVARPVVPLDQPLDTYDTLHPSATGEVKIASGFADALATLGVGAAYPRPLPVVPNGPRVAPVLAAVPGDEEAILSWSGPPGATGEYVWVRDVTAGEDWTRLPYPLSGTSWVSPGLRNFHDWEFRLQATKGTAAAEDLYSGVVTVRPAPDFLRSVTITPGDRRLDLLWPAVRGATHYDVAWTAGGVTSRTEATVASAPLTGLVAGQTYDVAVTPYWGEDAGSSQVFTATAGGPVPVRVAGVRATADRWDRVRLVWEPVVTETPGTTYEVQRRADATWSTVGRTDRAAFRTAALPVGRHAFRVRAWFELLPGPWSPVSRVRVP